MANKGFTIWFTGLSGSGKSTLSEIIEERLKARGHNVEVLDGDIVRTHLSKGLGGSAEVKAFPRSVVVVGRPCATPANLRPSVVKLHIPDDGLAP